VLNPLSYMTLLAEGGGFEPPTRLVTV
jgi:hypothetical protein